MVAKCEIPGSEPRSYNYILSQAEMIRLQKTYPEHPSLQGDLSAVTYVEMPIFPGKEEEFEVWLRDANLIIYLENVQ